MATCKPYVVGIDCGSTNTAMGIVDSRGKIVTSATIKTREYPTFTDYISGIAKALKKLMSEVGGPQMIRGIGVGAPNANFYSGNIVYAANLPWRGVLPLGESLYEHFGIPVAVTNDANAVAIGEMTYGAARGMRDFVQITLGMGIGSGVVVNGQLVYGYDGFAGEIGHLKICRGEDARECGCGNKGCIEAYASVKGLIRTTKEFLATRKEDSLLRSLNIDEIGSKDVYEAALKGDALAIEIFEYTGKLLGAILADFAYSTSPEAYIIYGGLSKAGDFLLKPVIESMEANLMPAWRGKIKVIMSQLNSAEAPILGASALGWKAE
ncbi:MAG: ROK family protein [Bacteroidales bacterium]|nr:ROK family protein [Bacteroidales bacterium]